jgi:hypothetical protein
MNAPKNTPASEPLGLGIYRFSDDGGRSGKGKLHTDQTQTETIERLAEINGVKLDGILDERSISGGTPLEQRPYGEAISRVEDPTDPVVAIIFAYRTRHDRDVIEGSKAIKRMDAAGGVLIVGGSVLTHATPDKWFEATMGSVMGEWQKRQIAYASHKGVARAVALGRVPYPQVPLGFILKPDHTVELADEQVQAIVRAAFELRAGGASIDVVRRYLAEHGHRRAYAAIRRMLASPLYVGEIRFGVHENLDPGFDAIVDREVWDAVQTMRIPAGRHTKSDRLLARLDVVHCGGCGGRMIAGANTSPSNGKRNTFYRCGRGRTDDCPERAVIKAEALEALVAERTREILCDAEERESAVREAIEARRDADDADVVYKRARKRLAVDGEVEDDEAAELLDELRADRDAKVAHAKQLEDDCEEVELVNAARDWDRLTVTARRRLIRAAIRSVEVRPGRGGDVVARCTIEPKRKKSASLAA